MFYKILFQIKPHFSRMHLSLMTELKKYQTRKTSCDIYVIYQNLWGEFSISRNSRPEVFCKNDVLRNSEKVTGKHLCQSLFFNKVADLRSTTLLKKRLWHRCFPVNFVKFLRIPFLTEHLQWLLLVFRVCHRG